MAASRRLAGKAAVGIQALVFLAEKRAFSYTERVESLTPWNECRSLWA